MMWYFIKHYDLHKLAAKLGGVGGSFVASHLVWLTTTSDYANAWHKIYMNPPTITDIPAFEKMVTMYFALAWLALEHFWNRFTVTNKPAVNPPKETSNAS